MTFVFKHLFGSICLRERPVSFRFSCMLWLTVGITGIPRTERLAKLLAIQQINNTIFFMRYNTFQNVYLLKEFKLYHNCTKCTPNHYYMSMICYHSTLFITYDCNQHTIKKKNSYNSYLKSHSKF